NATAGSLTSAATSSITVTFAAPNKLAFTVQPVTAEAAGTLASLSVAVQDSFGNTVTTATTRITLALGNNPSGATLTGTLGVDATAGVAAFTNLSIDKV